MSSQAARACLTPRQSWKENIVLVDAARTAFTVSGSDFKTLKPHDLLREAMRGTLPEPTRTRIKKTGWNAPAHVWFAGANADRLLDVVRSQRIRELDLYDAAEIERLVAEHSAIVTGGPPRDNHMMLLWQVANLTAWVVG